MTSKYPGQSPQLTTCNDTLPQQYLFLFEQEIFWVGQNSACAAVLQTYYYPPLNPPPCAPRCTGAPVQCRCLHKLAFVVRNCLSLFSSSSAVRPSEVNACLPPALRACLWRASRPLTRRAAQPEAQASLISKQACTASGAANARTFACWTSARLGVGEHTTIAAAAIDTAFSCKMTLSAKQSERCVTSDCDFRASRRFCEPTASGNRQTPAAPPTSGLQQGGKQHSSGRTRRMAPKKAAAKDKDAPKKVCRPARYCMQSHQSKAHLDPERSARGGLRDHTDRLAPPPNHGLTRLPRAPCPVPA